jgi:hypothetical protein
MDSQETEQHQRTPLDICLLNREPLRPIITGEEKWIQHCEAGTKRHDVE